MHKTPSILLLMFVIFGGAVAAAQQPKPPKVIPVKNPAGVCGLVTKADIEQAIGAPIGYPVPQMAHDADVCTYTTPKGNKVNILLSRSAKKRDLSHALEQAKKGVPDAKVRELPGLGDKALLVEDPKGPTMLSIYRGGDALVVSVYGMPIGPKAEAAVEKIARKAYKRLGPPAPAPAKSHP
jgi:hypothetical protein